jgi:HTH-type transcriptional regulator, sugar sensing transcriptional regulator
MAYIPQQLINSFIEFGLLESEAKIYSALVLFHDAEVKELQELLNLSRPSIYEGLRSLEDRGLIVLVNPKPATYQAIPPEIALDMLMELHVTARDRALKYLSSLKKENFQDTSPSNIWYIFGSKSFESKIKDMAENAQESIYCITSGRYLDILAGRAKSHVSFQVSIVSENNDLQEQLERSLGTGRLRARTLNKSQIIEAMASSKVWNSSRNGARALQQVFEMMDFDNLFLLVVDDAEFFYIPPLANEGLNAMSSKNKAMVMAMKIQMETLSDFLLDG